VQAETDGKGVMGQRSWLSRSRPSKVEAEEDDDDEEDEIDEDDDDDDDEEEVAGEGAFTAETAVT